MKRALRLENVAFAWDERARVFTNLDLEVRTGVTLLLGDNGSGKSTLLKLFAGVQKPDAGRVLVNGFDPWRQEVAARTDLAYVPQEPDVTPFASIQEVLRLVCRLRSEPTSRANELLARVGLEREARLSIRELSRGQRRRVLLAAAWIGSPGTVLLDEPLDAMDVSMRQQIDDRLLALKKRGGLALIVTHEAESFRSLADRVLILRDGKVLPGCDVQPDSGEGLA